MGWGKIPICGVSDTLTVNFNTYLREGGRVTGSTQKQIRGARTHIFPFAEILKYCLRQPTYLSQTKLRNYFEIV